MPKFKEKNVHKYIDFNMFQEFNNKSMRKYIVYIYLGTVQP